MRVEIQERRGKGCSGAGIVALTASWRKDFLTEQRTKRDRLAELVPETALRESARRQRGEMEMEPEEEEQRRELKLESLRRKFELNGFSA
ncbi:MAG: hypothetical protein DMG72_24360 [Acidobacteria bacterium]|nr:MAG: hypothetical protein DMG72_24360 [Acidobacteriota bacterium]